MLVKNQQVKVKWHYMNREWYESRGYHFTKYGDTFMIDIRDITKSSKVKVLVQCDYCGDIYSIPYDNYVRSVKTVNKCCCSRQECKNKKVRESWNYKIKEKQMQKFFDKCKRDGYTPVSTVDDYNGAKSVLEYICPKHGKKSTTYANFIDCESGCVQCGWENTALSHALSKDAVIKIVESKNSDKLLNPDDYINSRTKNLQIRCGSCGRVFTATLETIKASTGKCKRCGVKEHIDDCRHSIEEVTAIVESKNGDKLLNPEDYVNVNMRNLRIICGSCGNEFTTSLATICAGDGNCPDCGVAKSYAGKNKLSCVEVEQRINSVNGNIWLNPDEYISSTTTNLRIKCGECGNTFVTSLANYEHEGRIRCSSCSQRVSSLERIVINFLEENHINYYTECIFDDCKDVTYLPFDFYLPDYNLIIELDGRHHYEPIWGEEHFMKTILHDGMKNNYCRWNGIDLLRIPYWEGDYIEQILTDKLDLQPAFKQMVYKPKKRNTA